MQQLISKQTVSDIKKIVKERYGKCAETGMEKSNTCCAIGISQSSGYATDHSLYTEYELSTIPQLALRLSRGCGNPAGFAKLRQGETVMDFGCGAGIDVILAAKKVAPSGKVIGVDFSAEMVERAKQSIVEAGVADMVELYVADLAKLTLPNETVDVVMSNCVINLCLDKEAVYREAFRVLKPGGRLAISDVIYTEKIDSQILARFKKTWSSCVGGAIEKDSYFKIIKNIGFTELEIVSERLLASNELDEMACCPGAEYTSAPAKEDLSVTENKIASIKFTAIKPG